MIASRNFGKQNPAYEALQLFYNFAGIRLQVQSSFMKKIIFFSSILLCLNACKNEPAPAKTKTEHLSLSPVTAQKDTPDVVKDGAGATPLANKNLAKKGNAGWPKIAQAFFLNQCITNANFMSKEQAKDYCNCMLTKIQDKFSNLKAAGKMTREEAHALSQECLK